MTRPLPLSTTAKVWGAENTERMTFWLSSTLLWGGQPAASATRRSLEKA